MTIAIVAAVIIAVIIIAIDLIVIPAIILAQPCTHIHIIGTRLHIDGNLGNLEVNIQTANTGGQSQRMIQIAIYAGSHTGTNTDVSFRGVFLSSVETSTGRHEAHQCRYGY